MTMDFPALQRIVAGAGTRGASTLCRPDFWEVARRLLVRASRVSIVTGFHIQKVNAPETDGPPGAVVLGRALERLGKRAVLCTDQRNYACLKACSRSAEGPTVVCVDVPERVEGGADLLVFIERPGHATDGRYYDMRGTDVSGVVAPLDLAVESALIRGVPVLGIGDGGNEAGMGLLYEPLSALLPHYAPCLSRVSATVCLPVDVSNWGAYALTAVLSAFYRRWVGLGEDEEAVLLKALAEAGAVDGVSGERGLTVDGASLTRLDQVSHELRRWCSDFQVL